MTGIKHQMEVIGQHHPGFKANLMPLRGGFERPIEQSYTRYKNRIPLIGYASDEVPVTRRVISSQLRHFNNRRSGALRPQVVRKSATVHGAGHLTYRWAPGCQVPRAR